MNPERKKIINGYLVEEYYWAGKIVVYVDHKKTNDSFEKACNKAKKENRRRKNG